MLTAAGLLWDRLEYYSTATTSLGLVRMHMNCVVVLARCVVMTAAQRVLGSAGWVVVDVGSVTTWHGHNVKDLP